MNKVCTKCSENKDLEDYYRHTEHKDGKESECKSCRNAVQKEYNKSEKGKLRDIKYRKSDKGKSAIARVGVKYKKTEKGKLTVARKNHNRRTKETNIINTLTIKEAKVILFVQKYKCICCGKYFDKVEPTLDHIKPLSKGGDLIKENVQYLCQSCNSIKGIQDIDYRSENHKKMIERI